MQVVGVNKNIPPIPSHEWARSVDTRTTGHWMATGKAWGLASSLWEALLAWGAGGGPVEATAPTASTATY